MSELEALVSPAGRELLAELAEVDDLDPMRLAPALRERYPPDLVAAGLTQAELRRAARAKFSRAGSMFFTRPGLEQASAETVSRHRAERLTGRVRMADLCTGVGGDLISLAAGREVVAVDVNPVHLRMAELNARVYGVGDGVRPVLGDVRTADLSGVDAVFVDPARRTSTRRLRTGDSEPALAWCLALVAGCRPSPSSWHPGSIPGPYRMVGSWSSSPTAVS